MNAEINVLDELGYSSLGLAVRYADLSVVHVLLDAGADPNLGYPTLNLAAKHPATIQSCELIRALIEANATVDQRDEDGMTPLMVAFNDDVTKCLLDSKASLDCYDHNGRTALFLAKTNSLQLLIDANADIEHRDYNGLTPLMVNAQENNAEACTLLMKAKADVSATDERGNSVIELLDEPDHILSSLERINRSKIQ